MSATAAPSARGELGHTETYRERAARLVAGLMEAVVLALVCLAPWAFGSTETFFELLIDVGITVVLALWGVRMVLLGRLTWKRSPVVICLTALFLLGIWQLVPLGRPTLEVLAPRTARLYGQLLPEHSESLPDGEARETPAGPVGATLSVYPTATRQELIRLLGVLLLFAAVRNNIASAAALRRLSLVALANGALLALFGVVQFFSSPPGVVYWTYPTHSNVFGPFLNRNHFAWYANLCAGLGLGLLAGLGLGGTAADKAGRRRSGREAGAPAEGRSGRRRRRRSGHAPEPSQYEPAGSGGGASWSPLALLQDPRKLWVLLPVTLILCAMVFSLSRGALVAAVVAGLVCLIVRAFRARRLARLVPLLLVPAVMGAALLLWLGMDRVTARYETLWQGKVLEASRLPIWSATLPLARDFPVWGTGLGTYGFVESLHRTDPRDAEIAYDHAHNEYLELLVEGGIPGLLLGLAAAALVLQAAWRACRRSESRATRALALGALFALVATAAQAVVEFGLHIPAILLLVTVIAAEVAGLAAPASDGEGEPGEHSLRLWGLAPLLGAATAVVLGLVLCGAGLKAHLVQRYLAAAQQARQDEGDPDRREHAIAYLEAALALAPEYARLHDEAGRAHLEAMEAAKQDTEVAFQARAAAEAVLLPAVLPQEPLVVAVTRACVPADVAAGMFRTSLQAREEEMARRHLVPGLRHCLAARDLCPLLPRPQVQLAEYADRLAAGDGHAAYLRRAKALVPFDPELWYFSGVQELLDGQHDEAWASWRRCLELSDRHLPQIVHASAALLGPQEIMDRVLPEKPDLVYAAALELYPDPEGNGWGPAARRPDFWAGRLVLSSAAAAGGCAAPSLPALELVAGYIPTRERQPFLDRTLELLDRPPGPVTAKDFRLEAQVRWSLWQLDRAGACYREALARDGLNADWRYEYALLLYQQGRLKDARRELLLVLSLPSYPSQAARLLDEVTLERATKEDILK